jgi:hypothetical protein
VYAIRSSAVIYTLRVNSVAKLADVTDTTDWRLIWRIKIVQFLILADYQCLQRYGFC